MKPIIHAKSSAKKFGGLPKDYLSIHEMIDSTKDIIADNRHRLLFHNEWACKELIPLIFGKTIINSDGNEVSTEEIAIKHVLEDFSNKKIPTLEEWIENINEPEWLNKGCPNSFNNIEKFKTIKIIK